MPAAVRAAASRLVKSLVVSSSVWLSRYTNHISIPEKEIQLKVQKRNRRRRPRRRSRAKPPRRARCAPGHRTHTAERRDRPVHPRQNPPSLASPTVTRPTPKSTQCQTPHASARPPGRSRDGSRLADPHRQANLRRRGDLHRDGDALHHKRHVFASCRRRPTRYAGIELFTETRADSIAGGGG